MQSAHAAANAALNLACAGLLVAGFRAIRAGNRERHRRLMLAALGVAVVFLVSYVARFLGKGGTTRFPDVPWWRSVYLAILLTHTVLAAVVPFLALRTVWLATQERWAAHRRLARVTLPIWLYVSVTGVLIYAMLYHLAPALSAA